MSGPKKEFSRKIPSGRARLWRTGRPLLTRLDFELTERCNNNCIHCSVNLPAGDEEARRRELSAAEVKNVLGEAASLGCLSVRFTGGEPLLRDDFEEIYTGARSLGLRVRIFTNATLVTPELAALLRKVPPLEKMEVSIYGMSAESALAVTGNPDSHGASRRGLALLLSHGVPFEVKGAVLPPTRDELDRFDTWTRDLPGMTSPPSCAMLFDLRSRRDLDAKNSEIRRLRMEPQEYVRLESRRGEDQAAELRAFVARFAGPGGDRLFPCLADTASVDAYGRFQVCLSLRHPDTVYELRKGSLKNAVEEFLPKVREMRTANPAYLKRCGRCFLKALCLQCPAKAWAEHGTLDTPVEYFCDITHAQAVSIGVLGEEERSWTLADWRARVAERAASWKNGARAKPEGSEEREGERTWKAR